MTRTHRLVLIGLAVVVAVAAFVVLGTAGDDEATDQANATPTPTATATPDSTAGETPTPTPTPTATPTPDPGPLLTADKVTKIEVNKGDRVRFRARSATADQIHVHGYDLSKEVVPGKTAQMSFIADIDGRFEIEFETAGAPIGDLQVQP